MRFAGGANVLQGAEIHVAIREEYLSFLPLRFLTVVFVPDSLLYTPS